MVTYVVIIVLIALIFDFYNGMNDAANSIATVVATRVLSPRLAVLWAAFFNFIAAFFFKTHVAATIGGKLVDQSVVTPHLVLGALLAAIVWTAVCTHKGLPISVSHSLMGALAGAVLVEAGAGALKWGMLGKVAAFIVLSPLIGLVCAAFLTVVTMWICRNQRPRRVDGVFRVLQLFSAAAYSLSHGLNDAQKTMGIIFALLLSVPALQHYAYRGSHEPSQPAAVTTTTPVMSAAPAAPPAVPQAKPQEPELAWWIILSCHAAIACGTYAGGWKVIKTLGHRVTKLKPFDGFSAETGGGATIIGLSILGIPVSTTHTITGAIFGVGIVRRMRSVRWGVGQEIIAAWVLTLPCAALMAAVIYLLIKLIVRLGT